MAAEESRNAHWWRRSGRYVLPLSFHEDVVLVRGTGCEVEDADGHVYLDFSSGQSAASLGHAHPRLLESIAEQMSLLLHAGSNYLSPPVFVAAEKLAAVCPEPLTRSLFLSTGTEANECALRLAKTATGRRGVLSLSPGYFGTSHLFLNTGAHAHYESTQPRVSDIHQLGVPGVPDCPVGGGHQGCEVLKIEELESWLKTRGSGIAAAMVQPILDSPAGVRVLPPGYLRTLKELLSPWGILLVADECQTGFGRTGKWFGMEHHGVVPDILVFAKGAGGGWPVSGIVTSDAVAERAVKSGFWNVSSHQQDPMAACVVSAVIDVIREENLVARAEELGGRMARGLKKVQERFPGVIKDVRGQGLLMGVELFHPAGAPERDALARALRAGMRERGILFGCSSPPEVIRFCPPLNVDERQIDRATAALEECIFALKAAPALALLQ